MNFEMKSTIQNHRSASRGKTQPAHRSAGHCEGSLFSKIKPTLTSANPLPFVEDFNLEHTIACGSIIQETSSAISDFVGHSAPGKPHAYALDLNSPSCVYLG